MDAPRPDDKAETDAAHPEWFREPTVREHCIGAALFVSFALFFLLLFLVLAGWWFRWVILLLGGVSLLRGLRHGIAALGTSRRHRDEPRGE